MWQKIWWQPMAALTVLIVFLTLLYYRDNKYQTPPPYGKSGVITLSEKDLEQKNPVFLIDGWLLSDGRVTDKLTYIGEFSSLQREELSASPHGKARYQLTLRYDGVSKMVSVDFPELYSQYTIFLDGDQCAKGTGNGRITFLLTSGDHVLAVETSSKAGYYSGMYFPPALGTDRTIQRVENIQSFAYALVFLLPLALAAFTLFLWRTGGQLSRWFGRMCCCYALYMFRYFVFLFSMPVAQYWFLVQNLALYCLCFCVVQLTVLSSGVRSRCRGLKAVHSGIAMGSFYPWQADGYLLYFNLWHSCFFCCPGSNGQRLGKPLYINRLCGVWSWDACQSVFLQPL